MTDFETQISGLPEAAKTWLRVHPEYWTDPAKNRQVQSAHGHLVHVQGIPEFSIEYFDMLDEMLKEKSR